MSGIKTRTITDTEYYRLKEEARRAEDARRRAKAEEEAKKRLENDLKLAKIYNQGLENRIKDVSDSLKIAEKDASDARKKIIDTIRDTNKKLEEQAKSFDKELENLGAQTKRKLEETNRHFESLIQDESRKINDLRNQTARDIANVRGEIQDLAQKVGNPGALIDAGQDYFDMANELVKKLADSRHEMFCPGRMSEVLEKINDAKRHIDIARGNPADASNAISYGEEAFEAAHDLYQEVAAQEALWKNKLCSALKSLDIAQSEIEARELLSLVGPDGKARDFDTNEWSNGGLATLKEQVGTLKEILSTKDRATKLGFNDLDGIIALADDVCKDAEDIRTGAYMAITNSQERIGLAEDLKNELQARAGMSSVITEGYEGDDFRAANVIHLKNGTTGFEVIITLKPTADCGKCGYTAETSIVNPGRNGNDPQIFEKTLKEVMKDYGLAGDNPIPDATQDQRNEMVDWNDRNAKTVSVVSSNPQISTSVSDIDARV